MDAPGFPEGPESPTALLLVWGILFLLVAASIVVTVIAARRGPHRTAVLCIGGLLVAAGAVAALFMWLPAYVFDSPTGGGTCPLDSMGLAFMRGDKTSQFYAYWQPCRDASRRTIALALGGYAIVAGIGGLLQFRLSKRPA